MTAPATLVPPHDITIRTAAIADIPALEELIVASARALSQGFYGRAEIEAAIAHVFGVDSELVHDGTYLVATSGDRLAACGGWSRRSTLFGGDRYSGRASGLLDPLQDAARIRAFFVGPAFARAGVGSRLLDACEKAAQDGGFSRTALMATLPGVPFYLRHGYVAEAETSLDLGGTQVRFVPMKKWMLQK